MLSFNLPSVGLLTKLMREDTPTVRQWLCLESTCEPLSSLPFVLLWHHFLQNILFIFVFCPYKIFPQVNGFFNVNSQFFPIKRNVLIWFRICTSVIACYRHGHRGHAMTVLSNWPAKSKISLKNAKNK